MFCTRCGKEYPEGAAVCMGCGCPVDTPVSVKSDTAAFGFGVLGYFVPVVGLILWLVWKDERPKRAKASGIGALVSVIINAVCGIIWGVIFSGMIATIITELISYGVML